MCCRRKVPSEDRTSPERTELQVRPSQRSFRRSMLFLVPVFLVYIVIAVFASGAFRLIGVAGAIVFGVMVVFGGGRAHGRSGADA